MNKTILGYEILDSLFPPSLLCFSRSEKPILFPFFFSNTQNLKGAETYLHIFQPLHNREEQKRLSKEY